jgi:hypothetical protein
MATNSVFPRTAPESWGEWPPEQARFDEAARRALAAARRIAAHLAPDEPVIEVWMNEPGDFASTFFGPETDSVVIGAVLIPALRRGWAIDWEPATGAGKLREQNARFDFEQERLRRRRARVA